MKFISRMQRKYKVTAAQNREQALKYVSHVIDEHGKKLPANVHDNKNSILVGWQCGFEPLYVAIQNEDGSPFPKGYISEGDAEDIAKEYLEKLGWFDGEPKDCDYIHMP
jgi:hypothetical protein